MKRMIAIYGQIEAGKTHTAWLVITRLIELGAKVICKFPEDRKILTHEEVLSHPKPLGDAAVILEINSIRILVLTAGDVLHEGHYWSFITNIKLADKYKVDYVVCCARSINRKGSVYRELMEKYRGKVLDDNDWLPVNNTGSQNWLHERDQVAKEIVKRLLR